MEGKKIFLSGASGMVGRAILEALLENYQNVEVRAICYNQGDFEVKDPRVEVVKVDLRGQDECIKASKGCDYGIMAAATTGGAAHNANEPYRQLNDNVCMNVRMLEAFHDAGIKRVLQIGSATCYQGADSRLAEDDLDWRQDPHGAHFGIGWTTRFLEKVSQFWHDRYGIEIVMVRAANVFGPYAQFDPNRSNFIPALIRKAVEGMEPFEVWGSPDVERDVIYSKQFAYDALSLLEKDDIKFDVFNIGTGLGVRVGDVVNAVLRYAGHRPSEVKYTQSGPTNINKRVLDCTKLKQLVSNKGLFDIETGLRETVEWWKTHKERWNR